MLKSHSPSNWRARLYFFLIRTGWGINQIYNNNKKYFEKSCQYLLLCGVVQVIYFVTSCQIGNQRQWNPANFSLWTCNAMQHSSFQVLTNQWWRDKLSWAANQKVNSLSVEVEVMTPWASTAHLTNLSNPTLFTCPACVQETLSLLYVNRPLGV